VKISIDLDGTLWAKADFFCEFMRAMQARGHQVGILTGHAHASAVEDMARLYAAGFPIPDFYFGRTPEYIPLNGAHFKSMIIKREGIDLHFDDYDYDNADTIKLFADLGQEERIARLKAQQPIKKL